MGASYAEQAEAAIGLLHTAEQLYIHRNISIEICALPVRNRLSGQIVSQHFGLAARSSVHCTPEALLKTLRDVEASGVRDALVDIGDLTDFCAANQAQMKDALEKWPIGLQPRDVIINGFGRIGRLLVRQMYTDGSQPALRLKGIRVRPGVPLQRRMALLKHDSVHGDFFGQLECNEEKGLLLINGDEIPVYQEGMEYGEIANALMLESTGVHRDATALEQLVDGEKINQVLLTTPGQAGVVNLVAGISELPNAPFTVAAAASCTTNAAVPLLHLLSHQVGIQYAHLETVHAYTNDQNLVDNAHQSPRRGRSAVANMVMTDTGAGKAVEEILPALKGCISAHAVRVPVPDVSLLICHMELAEKRTEQQLHSLLATASLQPRYRNLIAVSEESELVSSDVIGDCHAAILDAPAISVTGRHCMLYAWYDNEAGYCAQVLRLARSISGAETACLQYDATGQLPLF